MAQWYSTFWRSSLIDPWRHVTYMWLTPAHAAMIANRLIARVDKPWHFGGHRQWAMTNHATGARLV